MTTSTATYRISITDTPSQNISNTKVTFTSLLTHQKQVILVSYTSISEVSPQPACPANTEVEETLRERQFGPDMDQWNMVLVVVSAVILLLATVVVCLALRQSSTKPQGGFASRLPPSTPAFLPKPSATPTSATPAITPLLSQSTGQSAFRRPAAYNQYSPNRTSPQHGLFSQQ